MNRLIALPALALVAIVGLTACSLAAAGVPAPAQPSVPAATPIATSVATPAATPAVSPAPSVDAPEPPRAVALETATGHHVTIRLQDESGRIVAARSGHPGDGVSVPFGTLNARNLDPKTVELTWSDTPGDAELGLYVNEAASVVLVIRPERPAGDAIAFDRVLTVEFDRPVDASKLVLGVQEGLDTAG